MSESHPIRNGILVTVIGGLLLALILFLVPSLWSWFGRVIDATLVWTSTDVTTARWVLVVLGGLSAVVVVVVAIRAIALVRGAAAPEFVGYENDVFFDVQWRWRWRPSSHGWKVDALQPLCKRDLTPLVLKVKKYDEWSEHRVLCLHCETCEVSFGEFGCYDLDDIRGMVKRQIERKINTGEYKKLAP